MRTYTTYIELSAHCELAISWTFTHFVPATYWHPAEGGDAEVLGDYAEVYIDGKPTLHKVPLDRITNNKLNRWAHTSWTELVLDAEHNADEY